MTLDEIESGARECIAKYGADSDKPSARLSLSLLAVLPVVRAAEGAVPHIQMHDNGDWACVECRPHSDCLVAGFRCHQHTFLAAVAEMHRALESSL